jgi:hypothetical protein
VAEVDSLQNKDSVAFVAVAVDVHGSECLNQCVRASTAFKATFDIRPWP